MDKILDLGKYIEDGINWLIDNAGGFFDGISAGIGFLVSGFQDLLNAPPFWVVTIVLTLFIYWINSRRAGSLSKAGFNKAWGISIFTLLGLVLLWAMGYWVMTMQTMALVISASLISLIIGIPLGIWASRSDRVESVVRPILDFMQTMPAFVYLIPAILFFGVGNVPGIVATVIFSLPPAVRLTNLGIRGVPEDVVEASVSFGATPRQLLYKVQVPLAMPTILAGVNQVIMLSLSMVVIASMVGAGGLGQAVYRGILTADVGLGFEAGLGIVILAIILDRFTQSLTKSN